MREDNPEALFSWAWKQSAQDAEKACFLPERSGSQLARVCKRPFNSTGEVCPWEKAISAQRDDMPESEHSMPLPLHSLAVTFLASSGTAP